MNILNNSQVVGSLGKNLVLNTLSKIYVRVGDRYYELDFLNKNTEKDEISKEDTTHYNRDVIITKTISGLDYPGDNKLVITNDGKFFITDNGKYKDITPVIDNTSDESLSNQNLNLLYGNDILIDFSRGVIDAKSINVESITADSISVKYGEKEAPDRVQGSNKFYIGPEVKISSISDDDEYVYFNTAKDSDYLLFSVGELVTNENESFVGEIVEISEDYIKTKIISGEDFESGSKLIQQGDYILYDSKWKSLYNRKYNIRTGDIKESGSYLDLEFATIESDVEIQIKSGTIIKSLNDCNISVIINNNTNTYTLYKDCIYLITEDSCINLTSNEIINLKQMLLEQSSKISLLEKEIENIKSLINS